MVHACDHFELDFLGASGFAFADVAAVGEALDVHLVDHAYGTAITFDLTLWEAAQVGNFCTDEESCGRVGTSSYAGAATYAGGGVHGQVSVLLPYGYGVAVRGAAGRNRDEAAGGDDVVERGAVNGEILDHWKGLGAPGFEIDHVTVLKVTHVKLADSGAFEAAMGLAVDHEAAHAADAFAAIVIEGDGVLALRDEAFVEDIEHFEERHVLADAGDVIAHHAAGVLGMLLSPDVKCKFHL